MRYLRLSADSDGESHVTQIEAEFGNIVYAPPAPEFGISELENAASYVFVNFPASWTSGLHPTPRRQLFVVLSGRIEGVTSTGEVLIVGPGQAVLMEDTTGKGHTARVLDDAPVTALMVHLE